MATWATASEGRRGYRAGPTTQRLMGKRLTNVAAVPVPCLGQFSRPQLVLKRGLGQADDGKWSAA